MSFTALKNAVLSEKIDWTAYTQPIFVDWEFPPSIDNHWKDIRPLPHYNKGQENKQGVKRFWNTENASQGRYVILDGVASGILRDSQLDVLRWVNTSGRKATRIDFALDITHSDFHPKMVRRRLERGEAVTHAQSFLTMDDLSTRGYTQYVGRKQSETYTRIYDKAAEQGTSFSWVRVETVYQGERARPALQTFCEGESTRALIRAHVDFPKWQDWQRLFEGGIVKLQTEQKTTRTREWLLSTVSKSIAKELSMDEDHEFWFQMIEAISKELAILGEEW